jgi:pyruvate formate-lyase/glycerol dehydratase family glycyl radical enzyme
MISGNALTVKERMGTDRSSIFIESLERSLNEGTTDFVRFIAGQGEPSTEGNRKKREAFFTVPFSICIERARYFTRSFSQTEGEPQVIRMAKAFQNYLENVTVLLHEGDLFAGYPGGKLLCSQIFPELCATYLQDSALEKVGDFDINPVSITQEEIAELKELAAYWQGKSVMDYYQNIKPCKDDLLHGHGLIFAYNMLAGIGHMIVDIQRVLKKGLKAIQAEALAKVEQLQTDPEDGRTPEKIIFFKAVVTAIAGVISYANRCAEHAAHSAAQETDPLRREELQRMARACRQVPEYPAHNFFEALQCTLLLLHVNQMESCETSVCPGRLDQFLYDIYRQDIETGNLTRQQAVEFLENFLIRLGQSSWLWRQTSFNQLSHPRRGNLVTITLSGKDKNGRDLTNELTYLILHAQANNALGFPNLAVRLHGHSPEALWKACARVIGSGKGQPAIMNDEVMVPALLRLGFEEGDAYNYADIGCIEIGVAGTSIGPVSIGFINLAKCLDLALHNGRCIITGIQVGPETGDPGTFLRYEQLFDAYKTQVRFAMTWFNQAVSAIEMGHERLRPIPFLSSITDNAMERGVDLTNGGSKYYTAGVEGIGIADVADSLAAIKKLVFEEKQVGMKDLLEALTKNFEDHEKLHQTLMNRAPKFGNDDDDVDQIARDSCSVFLKEVKNHKDYWGSVYYPGIWSIELAMALGWLVGALPSGRMAYQALTEGVAPSRGWDRKGPTAAVKSVAKLDHELMENGSIFNLKFSPDLFKEGQVDKFIAVMKSYFDLGGFQMQVAVVDKQALLDAQKHPEEHRDLIVRIAGYCAFFTELNLRMQQHIIDRTEHC